MRIAYVAEWDASTESGVLKKMAEQVRLWTGQGHDVRLFLMSPEDGVWQGMADVPVTVVRGRKPLGRTLGYAKLLGMALDWAPDVAYSRFVTYRPRLPSFERRVPTVLEINTDDVTEVSLYLDPVRQRLHRATRAFALRDASGFVCVTRELASRFEPFGRPTLVMANGIDLRTTRVLPAPPTSEMRFVFIGAPEAAWHGVDKIVDLAARRPDWRFDLIGTRPMRGMPPNVTAHGRLTRAEYEPLFAQADVAIGTMALHRKHLHEASPLKLREYLSFGLPAVIGYEDTDFPSGAPFLLVLPNQERNLVSHLDAVEAFAGRWKGRRVQRLEIARLDSAQKEIERLDFLRRIVAASASGVAPLPTASRSLV
jgi:hypothetical protein